MNIIPDTLGCSCTPMSVLARAPWRFGLLKFDVKQLRSLQSLERSECKLYGKEAPSVSVH